MPVLCLFESRLAAIGQLPAFASHEADGGDGRDAGLGTLAISAGRIVRAPFPHVILINWISTLNPRSSSRCAAARRLTLLKKGMSSLPDRFSGVRMMP